MATALRRSRAHMRTVLAVALSAATLSSFTPALAQPVNPDDATITRAQEAVGAGEASVSELVGTLASTQSELDGLELELGALREAVNKALVDLHDAQASAEQARQGVIAARAELEGTQKALEEAQAALDETSRAAYRRSTTPTAIATLAGEEASTNSLDRQTFLRTNAEKQREKVEELDRLRTEQANKESQLRAVRNLAEQREAAAKDREATARAAIDDNSRQISERTAERDRLTATRDEAQNQLNAARNDAATVNSQRQDYEEYREAEAARKRSEDEAARAAAARAEADAAAQAAADEAARQRAAAEAAQSQEALDAASRAEAAAAEAAQAQQQAAAQEQQAQSVTDLAATAAAAAAAALIAQSQPDHSNLTNPYPSVSDETAAPGPIAAVQGPEAETVPQTPDITSVPGISTVDDVSSAVSDSLGGALTGDRAATIEAVIARAESQLGQPYAWGGGNATGPTRGIRDGGVADANGDFNKIGFDCSGLTLYAFAGAGIALPHYTGYQYNHGTKVSPSEMQRGDLIFYGPGGNQHVAIYLGDGMMIEAPNSGSYVQKSPVRWSGMTEYAVRLV